MNTIRLEFALARAEISVIDHVMYIRISGVYTDDVAHTLIARLDQELANLPSEHIRVTDAREVSSDNFRLSAACIDRISKWGVGVKARYPKSVAYLIGHTAVSYGMARMYALKTEVEQQNIVVLNSFDELPMDIRLKLPR